MKYSDEQRIRKIIEKTESLLAYIEKLKITREQIIAEEYVQWAITTPLYNIGEHAYYLSDEFRQEHDDIPWSKISGLRHRLVHDYEGTNWAIISTTIFDILPKFLAEIKKIQF